MRTKFWLLLTLVLTLSLVLQSNAALAASSTAVASSKDVQLTYGFIQDSADPQLVTAVVYPNVSSEDVMMSTAIFSFLLPAGTETAPMVPDAPAMGEFTNVTGVWTAQKLTPALYAGVGFDAVDLQGRDVYQVVLSPGSAAPTLRAGEPLALFSFRLPSNCSGAGVEVLTNDSAIQQALRNSIGANFNNQMSMSVDGTPAMDQYAGNHATGASLVCPGGAQNATNFFYLPFVRH